MRGTLHRAADALSRIPGASPTDEDEIITEADDGIRQYALAAAIEASLPPSNVGPVTSARAYATTIGDGSLPSRYEDARAEQIRTAAAADATYQLIIEQLQSGWPDQRERLPQELWPYHKHRVNLSVEDGLVLFGLRLLIPAESRREVLKQIHAAHQGEPKSQDRANKSVWWPNIRHDVTRTVRKCTPCLEHAPSQANLPRLGQDVATAPFQRIHVDLAMELGVHWLVAVDEYSGYLDVRKLGTRSTADLVIKATREVFNAMGIPAVFKSDGGPQLPGMAYAVQKFLTHWGVTFDTSSPRLPETNGMAEAAVKAAKRIIRGAEGDADRILEGIEAHRNTPRRGGRSPSEMAFGRQRRERLPVHPKAIQARSEVPQQELIDREQTARAAEHSRYDSHARDLPPLQAGDTVVVQDKPSNRWIHHGTVVGGPTSRREYSIAMETGGTWRRNRKLIRPTLKDSEEEEDLDAPDDSGSESDCGPPVLARRNNHRPDPTSAPRRSSRPHKPKAVDKDFLRLPGDGRRSIQ